MGAKMRITYDSEADAMYIEIRAGKGHVGEELEPGVVIDLDEAGHVLGMEILDARERIGPIPDVIRVSPLAGTRVSPTRHPGQARPSASS
jgi:uncharacterized protein YuzE